MNKSLFAFIGTIQEEVHRFSIAYQRQQAKKKTFQSSLTQIPGVGEATAKKLLRRFKTIRAIGEAQPDELQTAGIGAKAAQAVYDAFHSAT